MKNKKEREDLVNYKILVKSKRAAVEFEWVFAILVGGMILVLAIYGAVKLGNNMRFQTDTEVAKKIQVVTDPLQAGFATGSYGTIKFNQITRINNYCYTDNFGRNDIAVQSQSNIGEKWQKEGTRISIHNKYIFSSTEEGKDYYVFSKPFNFPYKISDLIFLTSHKYCFISPPNEIEDEISSMKMGNIEIASKQNCSKELIKVCFESSTGCNITIYGTCSYDCNTKYDEGIVEKNGQTLNYVGSLMYAAIFSDNYIYECNVKRLAYRTGKIAELLYKKIDLMQLRDCSSNLGGELAFLYQLTNSSRSTKFNSKDIVALDPIIKDMNRKAENEQCKLW